MFDGEYSVMIYAPQTMHEGEILGGICGKFNKSETIDFPRGVEIGNE